MGENGVMSKNEKIIVFVIIAVCIAIAAVFAFMPKSPGAVGVISLDGKTVMTVSLEKDGTFTVPEIEGMEFEVAHGGIRVLSSDCPDKICVKTGFLNHEGMSAVCMPKKVIVTVEGGNSE